jgi:hypothetical protein
MVQEIFTRKQTRIPHHGLHLQNYETRINFFQSQSVWRLLCTHLTENSTGKVAILLGALCL